MYPEVEKNATKKKEKYTTRGELRMEGEQKGKIEKEGNEGGI